MQNLGVAITGSGSAVPTTSLDNQGLTQLVDTSDEWIATRTGIKQRRLAGVGESLKAIATIASSQAIAKAGIRFCSPPLPLMICLALLVKFKQNWEPPKQ